MKSHAIARSTLVALGFALVVGGAHPAGQQTPPQTPPAGRTLAAGAASVSVDFVALGRDGLPINDLRADEVTVKLDGKTRPVRNLQFMDVGAGADLSAAPASEPPPAPFATNDVADGGRTFVLMIDDESLRVGNEQPLRDAVSHFLTGLSSRDRVAVIVVPVGGLKVDFTTDRGKVRQAMQTLTGQANEKETTSEAAIRTRTTLRLIADWMGSLGGGQGPPTVVLFSSSLMGVRGSMSASQMRGSGMNLGTDLIRQEDFQQVADAAAAARVQFFVVKHDQMVSSAASAATVSAAQVDSNNTRAGLENLSGATGGELLALTGSGGETALTRIARETSGYWLATIDVEGNERNNVNHAVSVKVSREGVTARTRPTLPIGRPDASAARPTPTTPHAMLLEARAYRELALRAVTYASRNTDGQIKVVVVAETIDPTVRIAAAEAGLFDDGGHLLKQWAPMTTELGTNRLVGAFSGIPHGTYRLRVAMTDPDGKRGTTDSDVSAELAPAGSVKLSDLVLGRRAQPDLKVARVDTGDTAIGWSIDPLTPKLQFGGEPVALAYFDIYGRQSGTEIMVLLEVARTLNGPAFLQIKPTVDPTSEPDRFNVTAAVPIGALPPGDFVVRAIVGVKGEAEGRVVRTLRKTAG